MSRRPYVRKMPGTWWTRKGRYIRYMMQECTCILIGAYTAVLITGLIRLAEGREAYEAYQLALQSTMAVTFHLVALAFALYHTTAWFSLTPKAMPLELNGKRVPGKTIIGAHYAGWAVVSLVVLLIAGV